MSVYNHFYSNTLGNLIIVTILEESNYKIIVLSRPFSTNFSRKVYSATFAWYSCVSSPQLVFVLYLIFSSHDKEKTASYKTLYYAD